MRSLILLAFGSVLIAADLVADFSAGSQRTTGSVTLTDAMGAGVAGSASGGTTSVAAGLVPAWAGLLSPTAISVTASVAAGQTATGTLPGTDGDGNPLTYAVVGSPKLGTITFGPGSFSYTAGASVGGVDRLTVTVSDVQGNVSQGTLSVTVQANQAVVRAYFPSLTSPYQITVGTPVSLAIIGGRAPLTISATKANVSIAAAITGIDVDGDGQPDGGVAGRLEATSAGSGNMVVTDARGATATIAFTAIAPPAAAPPATPPTIPTSPRTATLFGALGPQTPQGVASLRRVFASLSDSQAVAYAWDTATASFVALPTEPTGGLTAGSGIFVASRVDLPVDFSGTPARAPYDWTLAPGWNFLAIPLLVDETGQTVTTLDPAADIIVREADGDELLATARTDVFSGNWWSFDGQNYQSVDRLTPGQAYWVRNRSEPARPVVVSASLGAGPRQARAVEGRRPPVPPSSSASAAASSGAAGGGCGAGGVALVMAGLVLLGLRARRASA